MWRTDGTAAGTFKLITIPAPNPMSSGYDVMPVLADSRLFVLVQQSYSGPVELYTSDGTVAGSKDLGSFAINLSSMPVGVNGLLYCVAQDESVGPQVWVSDGTTIGTHMVRRSVECPGSSCGPSPRTFFRIGSKAMFVTADSLWAIGDGGTSMQAIASIANPGVFAWSATAPLAYLTADGGTLWRTDGTAAGTSALAGVTAGYSARLLDDGRLVFFRTVNAAPELWKSDGTSAGTIRVGTFASDAYPSIIGSIDSKIYLAASTLATGVELWAADLDALTVGLLDDIDTRADEIIGPYSSNPGPGIALGSKILFPATDLRGRELWQSDGTAAGTTLLANIAPDPGGGVISGTVRAAADGSPVASSGVVLCPPSKTGSCDSTFTDSAGHYHFDGVIPGTYAVGAGGGYVYLGQYYDPNVSVSAGVETSGVDFFLVRGGTISGTVTRALTAPVRGINVLIYDQNGVIADFATSNFYGNYSSRALATGSYYAVTAGTLYGNTNPLVGQTYNNRNCTPTACSWQNGDPISVTNGATTARVNFPLHEYGTIAGTVRDDKGNPLAAFSVNFIRQGSTSSSASVYTDGNGAYLSPLLNPGSYYVVTDNYRGFKTTVYPDGTCSSSTNCTPTGGSAVSVTIDGATTGIDLQLTPTQGRIIGTIRDSNGNPFSGLTVEMRDGSGYYISAYGGPGLTDASGHYEFFNIPDGTYYIQPSTNCIPVSIVLRTRVASPLRRR
jgi:ELWxxDGT repeat protein